MTDAAQLDPRLSAELAPSVVAALEEWQASQRVRLSLDAWMTAGNTRAAVGVVVVTGTGAPSKVILKACPPDRLTSREPRLHMKALDESPSEFSSRHLVQQPFAAIEAKDKWRVLFQSIGGDSLQAVRPLESVLHDDRLPELVEEVVSSLLRDWNPSFETRQTRPAELLRSELGSKVDGNGPLVQYARDLDVVDAAWVRFAEDPAVILPNALAWALDNTHWPDNARQFWAVFGRSHGDLHPGNVLIRVAPTPRADDFRLIDLSAFSPEGSLAKDVVHLLLAILGEHFSDVPATRRHLLAVALDDGSSVPLELRGVREATRRIRDAVSAWQSAMGGMRDDWDAQFAVALVAESLEFVGRKSLPAAKRLWFFHLACLALDGLLADQTVESRPEDPATVRLVGPQVDAGVQTAIELVLDSCGRFTGSHVAVAVLAESLSPRPNERVGDCPWTAVVSFDPQLDVTGPLSYARAAGRRLNRLIALGQAAEFGHGSTSWLALGGLADQPEATIVAGVRPWRRRYRRTIDEALKALGRFSARPVTVVVFGEPDDRVRAVIEAVDDRFAERAQVVLVNQNEGALGEFVDRHAPAEASQVLGLLPCGDTQAATIATVPGHDGPVPLEGDDDDWIREVADLVDSRSGSTAGHLDDVGLGFLRGRVVSWFELSLELDVLPRIAVALLERVREDLAARDTRRIALLHYPGAGGTTLARRLAWDVHREYPTVYAGSMYDEIGLAQRVSRLAQLSGLAVLVVVEQTTDVAADRLFNRLRADSIPAVVVVVSRRVDQPRDLGTRSFYLAPASSPADIAALVQRYGEYAPNRVDELASVTPGSPTAVPFYFGLVAFQDDYSGLENYVHRFVTALTEAERAVIGMVALAHRYAGTSVAADLFANILSIPPDQAVDLSRALTETARGLLIEENPGFWRTVHWLVAAELLRQLLTSSGDDPEAWRLGLSTIATNVISEALEVFGPEPPDDVRDVLRRLFIVRENRELYGDAPQRSFSELLAAIPSLEGRLEVLRRLAEHFPEEPHFWAHYGRLLSYEVGDTQGALTAVNHAIALDERDSVFHHIRGMIYRRQLRDIGARRSEPVDDGEILRLAELGLADFTEAARLDDDSEYPHVATVQLAVDAVELAYRQSGCPSHAEFFAKGTTSPYRMLLERAEAAVDAIAEIRGPDPMSARAQDAMVSLNALYDDYPALLQGWRNLLDRDDIVKTPLRRRLARVYVRRAGDWRQLSADDRDRVISLLEDNLRDDPTDSASLRDWLRAARSGGASLDRASELVSYWATQAPSRDSLYYDYVVSVLQVVSGRESAWREASRKIERCRERAAVFGNRKYSYEWLGTGEGLKMLVHYTDLPETWDRSSPDDVPQLLRRMPARVASIASPQAGTLRLAAGGLEAFFVPARAGALRGRHENTRAEAVIGFSYDGLRAWSVRLLPAATS